MVGFLIKVKVCKLKNIIILLVLTSRLDCKTQYLWSVNVIIYLSFHLSIYIYKFLSIYLYIYLSINLSFYLSIYLSIYLIIYLFIYLCIDVLTSLADCKSKLKTTPDYMYIIYIIIYYIYCITIIKIQYGTYKMISFASCLSKSERRRTEI